MRYPGEPVAAVVAEGDRALAEDAAEAIVVQYEPHPAMADPLCPGTPPVVRPDLGDGTAYEDVLGDGDVDVAFADADVLVTFPQRWGRATAHPLETRAVLAIPDPMGHLTIYATHETPTHSGTTSPRCWA